MKLTVQFYSSKILQTKLGTNMSSDTQKKRVTYSRRTYGNQELFVTGAKSSYTMAHLKPNPNGTSILPMELEKGNTFTQSIVQVACASTFIMFLTGTLVRNSIYH